MYGPGAILQPVKLKQYPVSNFSMLNEICMVMFCGAGFSLLVAGLSSIPSKSDMSADAYRNLVIDSVSFKLCMSGIGVLVVTGFGYCIVKRRAKMNQVKVLGDISPTAAWAVKTSLK